MIRPGISYRVADYNDSKYVNAATKEGLWSGDATSVTQAISLRIEYKMMDDKLRLIASGRLDKFNYPAKIYFPYQLAATYKINENNQVRISGGSAYRTPLLIDLYSNLDLTGPYPLTSPTQTYLIQIRGNKNIRLLNSNMLSAGYRAKIDDKVAVDIEAFYSVSRDFSNVVFESGKFDSTAPVAFSGLADFTNITLQVQRYGSTISVDYYMNKWQFKPYITVQQSNLLDYSPYTNSPLAPALPSNNNNPAVYNLYSNKGTKIGHKATPSYYGGAFINYRHNQKLNINLNAYFYGSQTQLESNNLTYKDGMRGVENIKPKLILNGVVSYDILKKLNIFANFRNILNDQSVEFYKGDAPAFMVLGGAHFEF